MKLHIGGKKTKPDWKILNIVPGPGVDFVADITDLSQFSNDTFSEIYASHVLEHVPQSKVLSTVEGIYRVLKPRGKFYVSVPDLDILCHTFIHPLITLESKFHVMKMIFGGQVDANDFHYCGFNHSFLFDLLKKVGFSDAVPVDSFSLFDDTSDYKPFGFPISLNVVATK